MGRHVPPLPDRLSLWPAEDEGDFRGGRAASAAPGRRGGPRAGGGEGRARPERSRRANHKERYDEECHGETRRGTREGDAARPHGGRPRPHRSVRRRRREVRPPGRDEQRHPRYRHCAPASRRNPSDRRRPGRPHRRVRLPRLEAQAHDHARTDARPSRRADHVRTEDGRVRFGGRAATRTSSGGDPAHCRRQDVRGRRNGRRVRAPSRRPPDSGHG